MAQLQKNANTILGFHGSTASRSIEIIVPFQPVYATVYNTGYIIQKGYEHTTKCSGK